MKDRYLSLDVFRGATVCLMILVNNPGSWSHIFSPLEHAPWHGLTPTDLVFPFFLFAVGNAFAFVMPKLQTGGTYYFYKKIIKRSLLIFLIGLFLNWYPFFRLTDGSFNFIHWLNPDDPTKGVRIFGVLQRIAVAYFFASIIAYHTKPKATFLIGLLILIAYWAISFIANPADPYSMEGFIGTTIDKNILGIAHMYKGEGVPFDPEGLWSTIPSIVQILLGYLIGLMIKNKTDDMGNPINPYQKLTQLFIVAVALLVAGYCWQLSFPINKKIWTSSYVLVTTGLATAIIATMIYFIEIKKTKNFIIPFFEAFGKNPLFIFALSAFLPKTAGLFKNADGVTPWNWLYQKVLIHIPGAPEIGSLAYAICVIIFMWAICYWLDKKKIYIKV